MRRVIIVFACSLLSTPVIGQDRTDSVPGSGAWSPNRIRWQVESADGTKWAVLEGRRDVPGQSFTYAFLIPPGYWEHHWHASDARVVVVKGALRLAYGPGLDSTAAKAYPLGSYVLVPANAQHTMGADVETIIIGTAVGPWATHRHPSPHHRP